MPATLTLPAISIWGPVRDITKFQQQTKTASSILIWQPMVRSRTQLFDINLVPTFIFMDKIGNPVIDSQAYWKSNTYEIHSLVWPRYDWVTLVNGRVIYIMMVLYLIVVFCLVHLTLETRPRISYSYCFCCQIRSLNMAAALRQRIDIYFC